MLNANLMHTGVQSLMGHGLVAVVAAAEGTGVLEALEEACTVAELSQRLSLCPRASELTLSVLCAIGYAEERDGLYRRPRGLDHMREPWPQLEAFLRTGEVTPHIDRQENRGANYSRTVLALGAIFSLAARELAEKLPDVSTIVDVGAGSAIWSLSMAARSHESRVIAVDLEQVLSCVNEQAARMGVADRVSALAGDYFDVTLEEPADRIILANVLHLENEDGAARLIKRYADMLADDGELVIVDCMGGDTFEQDLVHRVYALHLGMRTAVGRPHSIDKLRAWCAEAGLPEQRLVRLDQGGGFAALVSGRGASLPCEAEMTTLATSELQALRDEVELSRGRLYQVFEGATDAMMVVRKSNHRVVSVNSAFRALFAVDWQASQVHELEELIPASEVAAFRKLLSDMASGRVSERRHRITMLRNGDLFLAELTAFDPRYRSSISFSVRDRDRMAREEKLQALGEIVGGVCHDLNTPLGSLKANTELIRAIGGRLTADGDMDSRFTAALDTATTDALQALSVITSQLESLSAFATLEGAALAELAPSFKSGLARAICERMSTDS